MTRKKYNITKSFDNLQTNETDFDFFLHQRIFTIEMTDIYRPMILKIGAVDKIFVRVFCG